MPQTEIAPTVAVHGYCEYCGVQLIGKQIRFCCDEHKNAYWSRRRSGTLPNPLELGKPFSLSLANPNPKFRPRKDGDHWFIEFEVHAEEAAHFLDPNINRKGMVIEAIHCEVTHLNQPENQKQEQKGGPLAKLAGMMCADQKFWEWLNETSDMEVRDWLEDGIINEQDARNAILYTCGIESRRELDHNPEAARIFHEQIRLPYMNWLERKARVT